MALAKIPSEPPGTEREESANQGNDDLHELLTVEEVAALLKVSKSWVYQHTRTRSLPHSQRLPYVKVGKYVRFESNALRAFIQQRCRRTT